MTPDDVRAALEMPSEWDVADALLMRVYPGTIAVTRTIPNYGELRKAIAGLVARLRAGVLFAALAGVPQDPDPDFDDVLGVVEADLLQGALRGEFATVAESVCDPDDDSDADDADTPIVTGAD